MNSNQQAALDEAIRRLVERGFVLWHLLKGNNPEQTCAFTVSEIRREYRLVLFERAS